MNKSENAGTLPETDRWNHNAAYHPWILHRLRGRRAVLDVGCGDGFLLSRAASVVGHDGILAGIEPDGDCAAKAEKRLRAIPGASVFRGTFEAFHAPGGSFDAVVFLASLHHTDAGAALRKAKDLLAPGGVLLVVGLAKPETAGDWCLEALRVIPAKVGSLIRGEGKNSVPTAPPSMSYRTIRALCRSLLPGHKIRRGLYYRYLLEWHKPV